MQYAIKIAMAESIPLHSYGISSCYWIMAEETANYFKNLSPLKIYSQEVITTNFGSYVHKPAGL